MLQYSQEQTMQQTNKLNNFHSLEHTQVLSVVLVKANRVYVRSSTLFTSNMQIFQKKVRTSLIQVKGTSKDSDKYPVSPELIVSLQIIMIVSLQIIMIVKFANYYDQVGQVSSVLLDEAICAILIFLSSAGPLCLCCHRLCSLPNHSVCVDVWAVGEN